MPGGVHLHRGLSRPAGEAAHPPDQLRVLGADHPDTLTTRNNLASLLADSGQVAAAIAEFRGLLDDQLRVLGTDHSGTLLTGNCSAGGRVGHGG